MKVSVAMAVYNGELYLKKQLDSIIEQLESDDELIISYNDSSDNTFKIIKEYENKYNQINVVLCSEKGVISNFNNALSYVNGDIIVLSDQDDVWNKNKINRIKEFFTNNSSLLMTHNCSYIDKFGNDLDGDLFTYRNARCGYVKNLFRNSYQGCCMAFRRELLLVIHPIPPLVAMHDQWIGLCAEKLNGSMFVDEKLIKYRRSGNNTSGVRVPIFKKLLKIIILINYLMKVKYKRASQA